MLPHTSLHHLFNITLSCRYTRSPTLVFRGRAKEITQSVSVCLTTYEVLSWTLNTSKNSRYGGTCNPRAGKAVTGDLWGSLVSHPSLFRVFQAIEGPRPDTGTGMHIHRGSVNRTKLHWLMVKVHNQALVPTEEKQKTIIQFFCCCIS